MAEADDDTTEKGGSGLDQLRDELGNYLMARTSRWVESAGDKLTGLTDQLSSGDGDSGGMLAIGKRVLGGENPMKAFLGEKAKGVKDKVLGGVKDAFGGGGGGKSGSTKVTNIIEVLDVGLPLRTVYDCWTQFEDFSSFTKGVTSVKMSDEIESDWKLKVAFSNRSWKATVEEQVPDERIVWNSEGAKGSTRGVISFHELTPNLTRIVAVIEYYPSGFFEKTGNLWRAQGRRLRLDMKHFQRYVTLAAEEEVEGWRGEIRDGEVVRTHEEGLEDDEDQDSGEQEEEDEDEAEAEDEYEEGEGEEEAEEPEEDDEEYGEEYDEDEE
ncbi:SRPBCC family protein [Streptomyces sp. NPDC002055]|uniref:SRPBCC family protein n=1 Tax=Streptomyces sp. NPDC002055 TaxID=3154534 RepID=UPI00331D8F7E